jgi:ABC-2 type transport system ATP-binding protein
MTSEAAMGTAISIRGLSKHYGRLIAVKDLRLEVEQGEIFGFLGLNGAGKTTTLRILLDLLRPTSGKAAVLGYDCHSQGLEVRARVGYLPGEMGLYSDMTGRDFLDFLAKLKRRDVDKRYRAELQDRLALSTTDLARRLREYSTGMKRKLGLIQAFQDDPELLILDEPTEGLDPLMQEAFYELLAEVKQRGRTVFMSSHVLSEVERVCDRVGLLRKGALVLLSTVDEIRNLAARRVRVIFAEDVTRMPDLAPEQEILETQPRQWTLRVNGPLGPLLKALADLPVSDLMVEEPHLEDVILKYYREGEQ